MDGALIWRGSAPWPSPAPTPCGPLRRARAERNLRVFAVGAATAAAAKAERFRTVLSTEGDVEALASGIATRKRQLEGVVLHPGAAEPAGDLVGALAGFGIPSRAVTLYETVPRPLPADFRARLSRLDGVLVHSPKAGRRIAQIVEAEPAPRLAAYCLSAQVAATLAGVASDGVDGAFAQ